LIENFLDSAWLAPMAIAVFQIYSVNKQSEKDKQNREDMRRIGQIQKMIESNTAAITSLERELNRLEMHVTGNFLPRTEFNEFIERLEKTMRADRDVLERHIVTVFEGAIAKARQMK